MEAIDKAIRLSPRDPALWGFYEIKGEGYFVMRQDDRAINGPTVRGDGPNRRSRSLCNADVGLSICTKRTAGRSRRGNQGLFLRATGPRAEPSASSKNSSWRWQIIRGGWPTMNGSLRVCGWQECPNEYDREAFPLVARRRLLRLGRACPLCPGISDIDLFRYRQGVIDLDAEITDSALDLCMSEQKLDSPGIAGASIDQGSFRASQ